MNDAKVYAPFRCVAAFADGSRLLFDGLTREQARSTMDAAMEQHGDIGWWNCPTITIFSPLGAVPVLRSIGTPQSLSSRFAKYPYPSGNVTYPPPGTF